MFKTIVFLETSLTHIEAKEILPNAVYMPSIKKGDVIRAIKNGYERILIIDGNFGWTPSVWHKEILIAIDYGIEVFGASSMGAIRAAELDSNGMKGVGVVYSMYKNGEIDGDDEVAIAFSAYDNIRTVPLVNIRKTLEKLTIKSKKIILSDIRKVFYAERTWDRIAEVLPKNIFNLIKSNYVDVKKEDAISLLTFIKEVSSKNKIVSENKNREFTLFEKKLIESVFNPVILNQVEFKKTGNYYQLIRAKNIIKLLSIPKTRPNLLYYQSLIYLSDSLKFNINEFEFLEQLNIFREEKNLVSGIDFKYWLIDKKLYNTDLKRIFIDYIKINKYLLFSYNYNIFLRETSS